MKIRVIVGFLILLPAFFPAAGMAAERKGTIEIGEGMAGMIGYGTLMSRSSLEQTLGHRYEGQAYPVHVRDYVRDWAFLRAKPAQAPKIDICVMRNGERVPVAGMVELNIYPEKGGRMNAILYVLPEEDLERVDKREWGYRRVDVTDHVEEYEFSGGRVYIYRGLPTGPDAAAADPEKYILIKEYVDQVTSACDGIGKEFRAEFERSTRPPAFPVVSFQEIIWKKSDQ